MRRPLLALLLGALAASCTPKPPPNVLVVVVDTLRADRVDDTVVRRGLTPFLASLAPRATVFRHAYAQSSWTSPSVASLWTSRYQSQHGVKNFQSVLSDEEVVLAEVLHEHGYVTAGFSANPGLDDRHGFTQGFDQYANLAADAAMGSLAKTRADRVNREVLAWLDTVKTGDRAHRPIFLYLQYMEPHSIYGPPPEYLDRMLDRHADASARRALLPSIFFGNGSAWRNPSPELVGVFEDLYDGEVASMDAQLATLFAGLRARGFLDDALVVVTADHGEQFHEHGGMFHGDTLYDELLRVPLLIVPPRAEHGTTVATVVRLIDVAPTILDFAGIPTPTTFEGRTLRSEVAGTSPMQAVAARLHRWLGSGGAADASYSELVAYGDRRGVPPDVRAWVAGDRKLIEHADGAVRAYDLASDPGEQRPFAPAPAADAALHALERRLEAAPHAVGAKPTVTLDEATKARLRALGYLDP